MKLSVRFSNGELIVIFGLITAMLLFHDIFSRPALVPTSAPASTDKIVTKEFCLVDDAGKTRARIALNDQGSPALQLFDKAGQQRAQLRLNANDVPSLRLYDGDGKLRSVTGFNLNTNEPVVVMFDRLGRGYPGVSLDAPMVTDNLFTDEDAPHNAIDQSGIVVFRAPRESVQMQEISPEIMNSVTTIR